MHHASCTYFCPLKMHRIQQCSMVMKSARKYCITLRRIHPLPRPLIANLCAESNINGTANMFANFTPSVSRYASTAQPISATLREHTFPSLAQSNTAAHYHAYQDRSAHVYDELLAVHNFICTPAFSLSFFEIP